MKQVIIISLFALLCYGCHHSSNTEYLASNQIQDTIHDTVYCVMSSEWLSDYEFEIIQALNDLDCNERLNMNLPSDEPKFYCSRSILAALKDTSHPLYFYRIEQKFREDPNRCSLQDSISRWLLFQKLYIWPLGIQNCYLPDDPMGLLPETHHLIDKYIDRDEGQDFYSLTSYNSSAYCYDVVNYIFSLPPKEQLKIIGEYYLLASKMLETNDE